MVHLIIRKSILLFLLLIPLTGYPESNENLRSQIAKQIDRCSIIDKSAALAHFDMYLQSGNLEIAEGVGIILQDQQRPQTENFALTLFLFLLQHKAFLQDDVITIAIALANNYLYSLATDQARALIRQDVLKEFTFYRTIIGWQEKERLHYPLRPAALVPKIFWADRCSGYALYEIRGEIGKTVGKQLTAEIYLEFVDRVETLERIHRLIKDKTLAQRSVKKTALNLEAFVHANRVYRSSMENLEEFGFSADELARAREEKRKGEYEKMYFGKIRRWDQFGWLNYQVKLYLDAGSFKGDCGATTAVQMGFYKAAGIPVVSFQKIDQNKRAIYTHNYPVYWHPGMGCWLSVQRISLTDRNGAPEVPVKTYLHFIKPVYHWLLFNPQESSYDSVSNMQRDPFYQGELSDQLRIDSLMGLGLEKLHMERIFFSKATQQPGLIFTDKTAPRRLLDTDADGLPDLLEARLGTDPRSADSDHDGFADDWELENGFDPKDNASPGKGYGIALDGIVGHESRMEGMTTILDPKNDYKASKDIYDIKSMSFKTDRTSLYVGITYWNDIRKNLKKIHSFSIVVKGAVNRSYWIQWVPGHAQVYLLKPGGGLEKLGAEGLEMAVIDDAEFIIPLNYFQGADALHVTYFGCGFYDGKDQISDDQSGTARISLTTNDWAMQADTLLTGAREIADPEGDAKHNPYYVYDIKKLEGAIKGNWLYCRVTFHHDTNGFPFGLHSLHLRSEAGKENCWIQFWDSSSFGVNVWKDGVKMKEWAGDKSAFDCMVKNRELWFRIPLSVLGNTKSLRLQYFAGSPKPDRTSEVNGDETGWLEL